MSVRSTTPSGVQTPDETVSESIRRQVDVLRRLRNAMQNRDLVLIIGAGITLSATADTDGEPLSRLTWAGLIQNGLDYLVHEGYMEASHRRIQEAYSLLAENKSDSFLDAANIMTAQMRLNGQLATWLESVFGNLIEEVRHPEVLDILQALQKRGVLLLSTNYDDLLERVCGLRRIGRSNKDELLQFKRRDLEGVLHLHGSWHDPHEVVLDSTDYYQVIRSDDIQSILRTFLEYKTILFLGCGSGLEDPNFSALLKWAGDRHENVPHRHCLLVRDGDTLSHKLLVRLKYGKSYGGLVPLLKQLLDDEPSSSHPLTLADPSLPSISRETIAKWLSPVDPKQLHEKSAKVRAVGSGNWFVEGESFTDWSTSQQPTFLWLRGISGAGKTTLMSTVIDNLLQNADSDRSVAYFYCSFDSSPSQITANILGSILAQLSSQDVSLYHALAFKHRSKGVDASHKSKPLDEEEIIDIILQHSHQQQLFIIIDAVNEAQQPLEVLKALKQLTRDCNIHIMISSVNASSIEEFLQTVPNLTTESLGITDIQSDVDLYVRSFLDSHYRMRRFPTELKSRIVKSLTHGSQGMFRWVQCQMVRLADLRTPGAISKALETLPPTLDQTYEQLLSRILPDDRGFAREILQLLTFSLRPLSLNEVAEALQITIGLPHLDESKLLLNPKDVLDVCSGLVDFDEDSGIVSLAHHSVKTYLTNPDLRGSSSYFALREDQADVALAEMCLTYLSFDAFSGGPCTDHRGVEERLYRFQFLDYAAFHWALHAQRLQKGDAAWDTMKRFLADSMSERENFASWVQILLPTLPVTRIRGTPPLYYAASFGLTTVVRYLIDMGADIEAYGGRHGATPLGIASFRGHVDVVKILLENGADPFIPDENPRWNSIQWAKQNGEDEVVRVIEAWLQSPGAAHLKSWKRSRGRCLLLVAWLTAQARREPLQPNDTSNCMYLDFRSSTQRTFAFIVPFRHYDGAFSQIPTHYMYMCPKTALKSHGDVDSSPRETYGQGQVILRIGNGGAGATGLLKALADDYLSTLSNNASIEWVCNHSRNTQLALLQDYIDIALTYERDQEALAAAEGWSVTVGCVFHDHFCLAGPASDPAEVRQATSVKEAFTRIANSQRLFHNRADMSATMWKERSIWTSCGLEPWEGLTAADWYKKSLLSPSEALVTADAAGAYLLVDRSTLLRQTAQQTIHNTTVFFEPTSADDLLMNSCYALLPTHASEEALTHTSLFLNYLSSEQGQRVIESFGKDELGGFPLFAPVGDGFAKVFLRGGLPRRGKWEMSR